MLFAALHFIGDGAAFGVTQGGFKRFGKALTHVVTDLETVDDDIDRMFMRLR